MKSLNVDGVIVTCWWGIVEGWNSQKYAWSGYRELFNIIREFNMKLQVTCFIRAVIYKNAPLNLIEYACVMECMELNFHTFPNKMSFYNLLLWGVGKRNLLLILKFLSHHQIVHCTNIFWPWLSLAFLK